MTREAAQASLRTYKRDCVPSKTLFFRGIRKWHASCVKTSLVRVLSPGVSPTYPPTSLRNITSLKRLVQHEAQDNGKVRGESSFNVVVISFYVFEINQLIFLARSSASTELQLNPHLSFDHLSPPHQRNILVAVVR